MDFSYMFERLGKYAKRVGRLAARPAVILYLVLRNPATPKKDKYIVYSALAYLVLPIDLISAKKIPILGWVDEAGSIAMAYKRVKDNITPEIEKEADKLLEHWLPTFENAVEV